MVSRSDQQQIVRWDGLAFTSLSTWLDHTSSEAVQINNGAIVAMRPDSVLNIAGGTLRVNGTLYAPRNFSVIAKDVILGTSGVLV